MHIEVLENKKNSVKIELTGENSTMTQLIAKAGWETGGQIAAVQEHPFTEHPKLVSIGDKALNHLIKAASKVVKDTEELEAEMKRALKR